MESLKNIYYSHKKEIIVSLSVLLIISLGCISFMIINNKYSAEEIKDEVNIIAKVEEKSSGNIEEKSDTIKVDVKGYVVNPGVYELDKDSRVIDAINASGGLAKEAYTRYINLSKRIFDENVIIVNSNEEIDIIKKGENKNIVCESTNDVCISEDELITSDINKNANKTPVKSEVSSKSEENVNILVNINTASLSELMTLKGIGENKAQKIIDYRNENGLFKTIEDIKNVKGIGEAMYAKIKENITV